MNRDAILSREEDKKKAAPLAAESSTNQAKITDKKPSPVRKSRRVRDKTALLQEKKQLEKNANALMQQLSMNSQKLMSETDNP